ncbi:MAG TPA: hypothetical protein VJU86_05920 [Pyrinomonadaceae bacterium]|nr:hypothetical protein [Pyrinomonadaceae bacterium]
MFLNRENTGFSAPKARNVTAQGNALGTGHNNGESAEGARYEVSDRNIGDSSNHILMSRPQRQGRYAEPTGPMALGDYISRLGAQETNTHPAI